MRYKYAGAVLIGTWISLFAFSCERESKRTVGHGPNLGQQRPEKAPNGSGERDSPKGLSSDEALRDAVDSVMNDPDSLSDQIDIYLTKLDRAEDSGNNTVKLLSLLAHGGAGISASQYVDLIENKLKGDTKGAAYNAVVVEFIDRGDFKTAMSILDIMPISKFREREFNRYFRGKLGPERPLTVVLEEASKLEVKEDIAGSIAGTKVAIREAINSGSLQKIQVVADIDSSRLAPEIKEELLEAAK